MLKRPQIHSQFHEVVQIVDVEMIHVALVSSFFCSLQKIAEETVRLEVPSLPGAVKQLAATNVTSQKYPFVHVSQSCREDQALGASRNL